MSLEQLRSAASLKEELDATGVSTGFAFQEAHGTSPLTLSQLCRAIIPRLGCGSTMPKVETMRVVATAILRSRIRRVD